MRDQMLKEDLERIVKSDLPVEALRNASVLITGATGLVGMMLVRTLLCYNDLKGMNISVIALIRNEEKARRLYGSLADHALLTFKIADLLEPVDFSEPVDYIFHCAAVTNSKMMVEKPVETIRTAMQGTTHILEFAVQKRVKSVVYLSSMEMYGSFPDRNEPVMEHEYGVIDPLLVRSNYPESKRMSENLCVAFKTEYGVPVKIARLAQTFGAGVLPGESRVFFQFAKSAMLKEDIVLHTKGLSEGNYCYLSDAVRGLLFILLKGENGEAYNIVNEEAHTTIAAMAAMVAEKFGENKCRVVYDIPKENIFGYAADVKMKLSAEKLRGLGWTPEISLYEAYRRMIGSMRDRGFFEDKREIYGGEA